MPQHIEFAVAQRLDESILEAGGLSDGGLHGDGRTVMGPGGQESTNGVPPGPRLATAVSKVSCDNAAAKAQCCGTGPAGSSGCGCEPSNPAEETSTPGKVTPEQAPETSGRPTGSAGHAGGGDRCRPVGLRCTQTSISLAHS